VPASTVTDLVAVAGRGEQEADDDKATDRVGLEWLL